MKDKQNLLIGLKGLKEIMLNENSPRGAEICKDAYDFINSDSEYQRGGTDMVDECAGVLDLLFKQGRLNENHITRGEINRLFQLKLQSKL